VGAQDESAAAQKIENHRPLQVMQDALDEAYQTMSADEAREADATEWSEALIMDVADEPH
jgi:hypothetical protein